MRVRDRVCTCTTLLCTCFGTWECCRLGGFDILGVFQEGLLGINDAVFCPFISVLFYILIVVIFNYLCFIFFVNSLHHCCFCYYYNYHYFRDHHYDNLFFVAPSCFSLFLSSCPLPILYFQIFLLFLFTLFFYSFLLYLPFLLLSCLS